MLEFIINTLNTNRYDMDGQGNDGYQKKFFPSNKYAGTKRNYRTFEAGNEEEKKSDGIINFKFAIGELIFAMMECTITETEIRTKSYVTLNTETGGIIDKIKELRDKIKNVKADSVQYFDKAYYFNLCVAEKNGEEVIALKRDREIV